MSGAFRATALLLTVLQALAVVPASAAQRTPPGPPPRPPLAPLLPPRPVAVNRTLPHVTAPRATIAFSAAPTDQEIFQARVFPEPFVPVGSTTAGDNRAFADVLSQYSRTADPDAIGVFETFLRAQPASAWRASILANTGVVYRRTGRISKALDVLSEAWGLTSQANAAQGAIGQFAIGESLDMVASLGQVGLIEQQLARLGSRPLQGPAAAKAKQARFTLAHLRQYPERVIPSGPAALKRLAAVLPGAPRSLAAFEGYTPTSQGMSLAELQSMAAAAGIRGVIAARTPAARPVVPSIVHLRIGHFSALVRHDPVRDRYLLDDAALGRSVWMDAQALAEETSDVAFLPEGPAEGWRPATVEEAKETVGRSCPPGGPDNESPCLPSCQNNYGTAGYSFSPINAGLTVSDVPLAYTPPRGPAVEFALAYSSRDLLLPQTFTFGNQGAGWFNGWLSYAEEWQLTCDATSTQCTPAHVAVLLRGGGLENHVGPPDAYGVYPTHYRQRATLVQVSSSPIRYERRLPDGSVEVFAQPDGAPAGQRRVFLTQVIDPQGQALTFTYDSQFRLAAVTDAIGQVTTLAYDLPLDPLKITSVTDPFGRTATLGYTTDGRVTSITDTIGLTSTVLYGSNDMVSSLTTPYGTTTFTYETDRGGVYTNPIVQATDALGGTERLEFRWGDAGIPDAEPAAAVPTGFASANTSLNAYNTVYWDKRAWSLYPGDTTKAVVTHWLLRSIFPGGDVIRSVAVPHSVKRPLENRVWYAYPGQTSPAWAGTHATPSVTARVLDDGTTQRWDKTYNDQGQVLSTTDPLGRQTTYQYATNGIDRVQVRQTTGGMSDVLATYAGYTSAHQAQTAVDAAGQTTAYTYNAAGQVLTVTNARQETTTYTYDADGRVSTVTGPVAGATTTYGYDTQGRLLTVTDADGYTVTSLYDSFDRPIRTVYPDATYETVVYDRLDVSSRQDRAGRVTRYYYDALRRLTATRDPLNRTIQQQWCTCGALDALVDANGHRTTWERDLQGRVTREVRADGTAATVYTYEPLRGRLKTATDPKQQVTTYTYALDNAALSTVYTNAAIATPGVSYAWDAAYARVATMTDGTGVTSYAYHPAGQPGAGQVASVDGPLSNDTITFGYDALGRVTTRSIDGAANTVTWAFDALGRATSEANVLGTFSYMYDGPTGRLAGVTYPNGQTSAYSYLPNAGDRRLQTVHHRYPNGTTLSKFDYTYDPVGHILSWRQQADTTAVSWSYRYDPADQLIAAVKQATDPQATVLQRYAYAYDPGGNRTAEQIGDTVTGATYDPLNRLVSQQAAGGLRFAGTVSEPATVTVQGVRAVTAADQTFQATVPVTAGTNVVSVVATDPSGNSATAAFDVDSLGTPKAFTYDANGNLTADATRTLEWDAKNRLVAVNVGTHRSEFTYDGLDRRVRIVEKENGGTVRDANLFWGGRQIIEERLTTGEVNRFFANGEQHNGAARYLTRDHLGSVREVTDGSGAIVTRNDYDSYGRLTRVGGTEDSHFGFTGHMVHGPSGLALALYRVYDPTLGRWLSQDPAKFINGTNLFAYVTNSPVRYVDPLGLAVGDWWDVVANLRRARAIAAEELSKRPVQHNDAGDAMRHAEWMRRTSEETNALTAWLAGTGHELEGLLQGQPLNEALMDLHNNAQGRRAGSEGKPMNPNSLQTIGGPDKPYNPPKPGPKGYDTYPKSAEGSCPR